MNCLSAEVQTEIFSPSEFKAQNANKTAKTRVKRSKYKLVNPNSSFALSFITYKHDFCPRRNLNSVGDYSSSSLGVVCRLSVVCLSVVRLQF